MTCVGHVGLGYVVVNQKSDNLRVLPLSLKGERFETPNRGGAVGQSPPPQNASSSSEVSSTFLSALCSRISSNTQSLSLYSSMSSKYIFSQCLPSSNSNDFNRYFLVSIRASYSVNTAPGSASALGSDFILSNSRITKVLT